MSIQKLTNLISASTASQRKKRLFACACCRVVWRTLNDEERHIVEELEKFADGLRDQVYVPRWFSPIVKHAAMSHNGFFATWVVQDSIEVYDRMFWDNQLVEINGAVRPHRPKQNQTWQAKLWTHITGEPT